MSHTHLKQWTLKCLGLVALLLLAGCVPAISAQDEPPTQALTTPTTPTPSATSPLPLPSTMQLPRLSSSPMRKPFKQQLAVHKLL